MSAGAPGVTPAEKAALEAMIRRARRLVFFGGAGVSTASGIPDFRSADGLYAQRFAGLSPEMILSRSFLHLRPNVFFDYCRACLLRPDARPNAAHRRLAALEREGKLTAVVTQNIDGLHRMAGSRSVFELHGSLREWTCMECGASFPGEILADCAGIPRCSHCGGAVRPEIVLYGEPLPPYVCIGAKRELACADTLIVAGTSLRVEPAASFLESFRGHALIVINREPTPADSRADLVIRGDVAEALAASDGTDPPV